jgi:hypothetical protein
MSLLRHLVKADFRQFRWILVIWCGLVVTSATIHGGRPMFAEYSRPYELLGLLAALVWTGGLLVMLGFIAQVVQAHPLVGTTAFWMTRPIPPRTLLGAKLVFVCIVMVLVPVVAEMALMAAHRVSLETMIVLALQAAIAQAFWVFLAMSFAALTPGLAQFFLLCGATPVAVALGLFLMTLAGSAVGWDLMAVPAAFEQARAGAAFVVLTIIAAATLLLVLYHTRSRARSVIVGAAMLLLALSLPELLQRPVGIDASALPQWAATLPQPTMDPASILTERRSSTDDAIVRGRVALAGMLPNWSALAAVKSAGIDVGGTTIRTTSGSSGMMFGNFLSPPAVSADGTAEPSTEAAVKHILGVDTVVGMPASDSQLAELITIPQSDIGRFSSKPVHYRGTLTVSFSERTVAAVLPLRRGSTFTDGATRLEVTAFDVLAGQYVRVTVRESVGRTIVDETSPFGFEIYLRNAISREAVYGEYGSYRQDFSPSILWPVAVVTEGRPLGFRVDAIHVQLPPYTSNVSMRLDPAWLDRAQLVIVRVRQGGSLERILDIPAVRLTAASLQ